MADDLSAHALLVQFKLGNLTTFETLYGRYGRLLIAYLVNDLKLIKEDAEDCVQDFFLEKILEAIDTYDVNRGGGEAWIKRVCHNLAIDRLISLRKHPVSVDVVPEETFASHDLDPAAWAEQDEWYLARYIAWEQLSEEDRILLRQVKPGPRSKPRRAAEARFREAINACYNSNMQEYLRAKAQWTQR